MKTTIVRYTSKPEAADENQRLIEAVFEQLAASQPGFDYQSYRLADGVNFIHIATEYDNYRGQSLADVPAFQEFVANIGARCDVPPAPTGATRIGIYAGGTES